VELLPILLALIAGTFLPVQAATNAAMRTYVGRPEWAALVNFGVGLLGLVAWVAITRAPLPTAAALARAPWWTWTGGLVGAFYVSAVVLLTPRLGIGTTLALTLAGQMAGALLLDHYGAMGLAVRTLTVPRVIGAGLLVAGVVLMRR
jgi:bacterial/archaeal transporter family-2 protein